MTGDTSEFRLALAAGLRRSGMSLRELARRSGVHASQISRFLGHGTGLSVANLQRLFSILPPR